MAQALIETAGLTKVYGKGAIAVHALRAGRASLGLGVLPFLCWVRGAWPGALGIWIRDRFFLCPLAGVPFV